MIYSTLNHIRKTVAEEYDIFNKKGTHSCEDDNSWDYNCMAYAFKIFGWFLPFGTMEYNEDYCSVSVETWNEWFCEEIDDEYNAFENIYDIMEELNIDKDNKEKYNKIANEICSAFWNCEYENEYLMELAKKRMLKSFSGLREISSFGELNTNEYGIIYATGGGDFHFVRYEDGVYSHKMGGWNIETLNNEDEGFGHKYNSKRIYFAMKKTEIGNYIY